MPLVHTLAKRLVGRAVRISAPGASEDDADDWDRLVEVDEQGAFVRDQDGTEGYYPWGGIESIIAWAPEPEQE